MISIEVLILDDAEADCEFMVKALSVNTQLRITTFFDPNQFKENLSEDTGLVILDVSIPKSDYDIFKTIEHIHKHYEGICIIVISGYFDVNIMRKLMRLRVDDTVEKTDHTWVSELKERVDVLLPNILHKQTLLKKQWTLDG